MKQMPVLQAFILADDVYQGVNHRKFSIVGTFNMISSSVFPSMFHKPTKTYINVAELLNDAEITLRYVDLEDLSVLFESPKFPVKKAQNNRNIEVIIDIPPFPIPHPGVYHLELWIDDALLSIVKVIVEKIELSQNQPPQNQPPQK
ncbi:MAG: hypothetical protein K8S87_04080 [Planctomycetes bacterium]|nr:hypothetical protein [Planctomycetota bacterium]